jgi:hypothetical protein
VVNAWSKKELEQASYGEDRKHPAVGPIHKGTVQ